MSNIQSSFDSLSPQEFLEKRNDVMRAVKGMTEEKNVDMKRDLASGHVLVRITDVQVDSIEKMNALLELLGNNAVVETDERQEMRRRSGQQEQIGTQAA